MPATVPGLTLSATKQASGGVQLLFIINGANRFCFSVPNADFTALNTTVNGGATGANITKSYAQDTNLADYPLGYVSGA